MMQLPDGLFYELEDLPAQVQERAIRSFLDGSRKIIRAMIRQRQSGDERENPLCRPCSQLRKHRII